MTLDNSCFHCGFVTTIGLIGTVEFLEAATNTAKYPNYSINSAFYTGLWGWGWG